MSTNAQDMCQIICRNIQAINFQNISFNKFVATAIYSESSKRTETSNKSIIIIPWEN